MTHGDAPSKQWHPTQRYGLEWNTRGWNVTSVHIIMRYQCEPGMAEKDIAGASCQPCGVRHDHAASTQRASHHDAIVQRTGDHAASMPRASHHDATVQRAGDHAASMQRASDHARPCSELPTMHRACSEPAITLDHAASYRPCCDHAASTERASDHAVTMERNGDDVLRPRSEPVTMLRADGGPTGATGDEGQKSRSGRATPTTQGVRVAERQTGPLARARMPTGLVRVTDAMSEDRRWNVGRERASRGQQCHADRAQPTPQRVTMMADRTDGTDRHEGKRMPQGSDHANDTNE
jgi:hypothetical protein